MFFKNNKEKSKEKRISVSNLYICALGLVSRINGRYKINNEQLNKPLVILELENNLYEVTGKSPVNNVEYKYFYDNYFLDSFIGRVMIFRIIPLVQLDGISKGSYTINEIKYLEDELNKKTGVTNITTDKVMSEIKKLADKAMKIFDDNIRSDMLARINSLGIFYVNEFINIKNNKNETLTMTDPEIALINECLRQIVEIERNIDEELSNNTLRQDLEILERSIRGN